MKEKIWTHRVYESTDVSLKDLKVNDFCYSDYSDGVSRVVSVNPLFLSGYKDGKEFLIASDSLNTHVRKVDSLFSVGSYWLTDAQVDDLCSPSPDFDTSDKNVIVYIGYDEFVCDDGFFWSLTEDIWILDENPVCDGNLFRVCLETDDLMVLVSDCKGSGFYMTIEEAIEKGKKIDVYIKN